MYATLIELQEDDKITTETFVVDAIGLMRISRIRLEDKCFGCIKVSRVSVMNSIVFKIDTSPSINKLKYSPTTITLETGKNKKANSV